MPTRNRAPLGSPCWTDLWTSDVEGSRAFYSEVFGWEAQEPSPEFGGYFMFTREGVPVAGAMGDMGDTDDMRANDTWKIYLNTPDLDKTVATASAEGAHIMVPPMAIADLGTQAVLADATGAHLGAWEPGTFEGFTVLGEHGAPSWFELFTRDFTASLEFYRTVFRWETDTAADTDEFRYATVRNPDGEGELAGIMDASAFLPEGVPAHWSIYWEVDDPEATISTVTKLGGSIVAALEATPYGRMATVADPSGAQFKLRQQHT
jgi:predicted enzyme related to lactoylglutathione lyase